MFNRIASLPEVRSQLQQLKTSQESPCEAPKLEVPSGASLIAENVGGLVLEEKVPLDPTAAGEARGLKIIKKMLFDTRQG